MSFHDILVQVDDTPAGLARARLACALGARWELSVSGVFLKSDMLHNFFALEGLAALPPQTIDAVLKEQSAAIAQRAAAAQASFRTAGGAEGEWAWRVIDGDLDAPVIAHARRFDLTVFPTAARACLGDNRISAASLAMGSGGPVLVVPDEPPATVGDCVLVAWNGSREAARALRDAAPFLDRARQVHILVVSPLGEAGPRGLLEHHLLRHGWTANIIVDPADDASAAEVLRQHAAALQADLIVMGLYGRPRLQEWVFGGVSQSFLRDPPAALLVSH